MNKNWITHYVNHHSDVMLEKSLRDCHARGVDSILFDDTPEARIRLFIAHEGHELWKNSENFLTPSTLADNLSVGFHPHHCDLTLETCFGVIYNVGALEAEGDEFAATLNRYRWDSAINGGKGFFTLDAENCALEVKQPQRIERGESLALKAQDLHTVYVPQGLKAAWFVYEGAENPFYENVCYSNADLTAFDATGMYRKMDEAYMMESLQEIGLI